jgi:hypothetical protein
MHHKRIAEVAYLKNIYIYDTRRPAKADCSSWVLDGGHQSYPSCHSVVLAWERELSFGVCVLFCELKVCPFVPYFQPMDCVTEHIQLKSEVYIHLSQIHLNSVFHNFGHLIRVKMSHFRSVRITTLFKECEMSE